MEIFDRTKAILFNPKEEWRVIEAENAPHAKVFSRHLLILALIPAVAIFVSYWWQGHSKYLEIISRIDEYLDAIMPFKGLFDGGESETIRETIRGIVMATYRKMGIIESIPQLIIILCGAYIAAAVINAFSDQFGSAKDFNRAFSLVAYSFTPLCVAGILYLFEPLSLIVPYVGLYGLYLLYVGLDPQLKPAVGKKTICLVISLIIVIAAWAILSKIVPEIAQSIIRVPNEEEMLKEITKAILKLNT